MRRIGLSEAIPERRQETDQLPPVRMPLTTSQRHGNPSSPSRLGAEEEGRSERGRELEAELQQSTRTIRQFMDHESFLVTVIPVARILCKDENNGRGTEEKEEESGAADPHP